MHPLPFQRWLDTLRQRLVIQQHRCLVVLHGELCWSNQMIKPLLTSSEQQQGRLSNRAIAYGKQFTAEPALVIANYRHHLGSENDLVFFADADFHPDAFAALSGTIKAGGVMLWLCPPVLIKEQNNLFIQRIWQQVTADDNTLVINEQDECLPDLALLFNGVAELSEPNYHHHDCTTPAQFSAVQAIEKVATGHRNRPLVLTADRGRGKSSALAIAVANLLQSTKEHSGLTVLVTAPHSDAVKVFFAQLQHSCPLGTLAGSSFCFHQHQVQFIAVDNLVHQLPSAHLLLVDEAAGIPVYLLAQFVENYHRIVFCSTVHGYEGAGRGFSVKFKQLLAQKAPEFKQLHLHQPIRWQQNDPLEQLIFNSFLLAGYQNDGNNQDESLAQVNLTSRMLSQQQLFNDEALLQQVFNVLVRAHYQTTPSDLKLLLNNNSLRIFATFAGSQCIAVALAMVEGVVEHAEIKQVAQSQKRLKNHFLPQSLYLHANCQQAFEYSYLRVMRIAVVEQFQQQGIGLGLLTQVQQYAQQQDIAILGTSFGANHSLLQFWHKANYQVVRIGFSRDKASGEHSALLLQPLNSAARGLFEPLQQEFYRQFSFLLNDQFQWLPYQLVYQLLKQCPETLAPQLTTYDQQVIANFIEQRSLYDNCAYSLHLGLLARLNQSRDKIAPQVLDLLVSRILQKQRVTDICQRLGFTGKKQFNQALISGVKQLMG
ncbi:tRNA(Met) cytidine acetyltransferase TmcA [Thalassotalea insulae]|uniref:tRNA(Met) cytidine acetyltransferase TmcA n=1 Tax=Thalassotalea insulae TaxID=2056778 RepID=A0ABQ6GYI7_9GAMM|nr:GNAT family N-acetyltransferase [Thalassotalea insulae]GLX79652.1 tRNA(Met) cytidine acetyltransferase TmcA [Thalassotalea insulae]